MKYNLFLQYFGGRGSSSGGGGGPGAAGSGANTAAVPSTPQSITAAGGVVQDFQEAFHDGKDYQAVNGVDHIARTVSRTTQSEWDQFANQMNNGVTQQDEAAIMRDWSNTPNANGDYVSGYVRTRNSFAINEALYDPKNAGKTDAQIFKRPEDRRTVAALDKAINNNATQSDGSYTRFCTPKALQAAFGFSDTQMQMITNAGKLSPANLAKLNQALSGSTSRSNAYTSVSANRSLNAFSNPNNRQSRGFIIERKLNVPKGTKAYAPRNNAQESEVLFGRGLNTSFGGISISSDGHIVIHEVYNGYS